MAVAALAASLLLARSRDDGEGVVRLRFASAGDGQPERLQLDAIRAAGL